MPQGVDDQQPAAHLRQDTQRDQKQIGAWAVAPERQPGRQTVANQDNRRRRGDQPQIGQRIQVAPGVLRVQQIPGVEHRADERHHIAGVQADTPRQAKAADDGRARQRQRQTRPVAPPQSFVEEDQRTEPDPDRRRVVEQGGVRCGGAQEGRAQQTEVEGKP